MTDERFDLYFGPTKLGAVTTTDMNFPWVSGTVDYEVWLSNPRTPDETRLARWIWLMTESSRLVRMEEQEDWVDAEEERTLLDEELLGYMDFLDSSEWALISESGERNAIQMPMPLADGEIQWRWAP